MGYNRTSPEVRAERERLQDNFDLMQVHDVLVWDSTSLHYDTRELYRIAATKMWKISITCAPPLTTGYRSGLRGRMTITRIA